MASSAEHAQPRFCENTKHIVSLMMRYSTAELAEIFKISTPLAQELRLRFTALYEAFSGVEGGAVAAPAVCLYDGVVFKHFKNKREFAAEEAAYLQKHVRISSLLWGVLRPFDEILPYRMEGYVRLAGDDVRVDRYWRDVQTEAFVSEIKDSGGVLLYLASKEEQSAFHWSEVKKAVRVIDIKFYQQKAGKLKQVVVYAKMARGEMIRYMIEHKTQDPEQLKSFEWSGYTYQESLSTPDEWVWLMQ